MVYVLNQNGQPLMPTNRHGKVKHLLRSGKAKVVRTCPFTIKLLYESTNHTQTLTLGVDTGSSIIGAAVSDGKGKIVYMSKVIVRNDITDKMTQRRSYRRSRRGRKTRYRKARFLNRGNSIKEDRFSPTMTSKFHSHDREIGYVKSILPVTKVVLETGTFDPHLMKNSMLANPKIRHWGYQKGINYGFENTKAMVRHRDGYTCRCCKGKRKDSRLEVHHIIYRSNGGSDDADNLITLCHLCHKDIHKGKIVLKLNGSRKGTLKHATQMNSIRNRLLRMYPDAEETFGYVTGANRMALELEKDHYIDACVIASGGSPVTLKADTVFVKRCIPKGDFQKTKGVRSEQPVTTGKICGFRKFDKVRYFGKNYFIKGRMSTGYTILMDIYGNKADFSNMPKGFKTPKLSNCKRIEARNSWMVTTEAPIQNIA